VRDAARACDERTNCASIRRCGPATTQRFDRDRSRGERPNDLVESLGRAAYGTASEAHQGANGPGHTRRQRNMGVGVEVEAHRRDVIRFLVCALTPQFSCGRSAQYAP